MIKHRDRAETIGWLLLKLTLGFGWTHAMLFVTPDSIAQATDSANVVVWTVMTAVGALVSIIGMGIAHRVKGQAVLGYTIEFVGIVLFAGGPLQYLLVQVGFWSDPDAFRQRYALGWFALAMCISVGIRGLQVLHKRRASAAALLVFGEGER